MQDLWGIKELRSESCFQDKFRTKNNILMLVPWHFRLWFICRSHDRAVTIDCPLRLIVTSEVLIKPSLWGLRALVINQLMDLMHPMFGTMCCSGKYLTRKQERKSLILTSQMTLGAQRLISVECCVRRDVLINYVSMCSRNRYTSTVFVQQATVSLVWCWVSCVVNPWTYIYIHVLSKNKDVCRLGPSHFWLFL